MRATWCPGHCGVLRGGEGFETDEGSDLNVDAGLVSGGLAGDRVGDALSGKSGVPSNFSRLSFTMWRIRSETSTRWTPSRNFPLEAVAVEQREKELEALLLAVVRCGRHQQEVACQPPEGSARAGSAWCA